MAVDTSIYGLVRPPSTPFNLTGTLRDVESLRGLTLQRKSLQRQEADAERESQERAAVRDVFAKNVDETGSLNRKAVLADLAKVSPMKAMELQTTFRRMDAEDAVAQQKTLANRMEQMGALADLALSAKDQASYDALRASAQQMGL